MPDQTVVIGFDSCTPALVRSMVDSGELPAFASVIARSSTSCIAHERGYFVGSSWPTMMTGVGVVEHGWTTGYRFRPEHYDYVLHPLATPTVWEHCSAVGKRVAAFDVPRTECRPVSGAVVAEWSGHDKFFGTTSWPPTLIGELERDHGRPVLGTWDAGIDDQYAPCDRRHLTGPRRTIEQEVALFAEMLAGLEQKASASVSLLSAEPWDLFVTVFGEAHCVGHQFWHLHDVDHPWFAAHALDELGVDDPVRAMYRKLDAVLADHLAVVPDDATVIVLLSHGTARWRNGVHCLDPILHRLELARTGRPVPTVGPRTHRLGGALAMIPQRWRRRSVTLAGRMIAPQLDGRDVPADDIGPTPGRRWFAVRNNSHTAALRLNVIGREGAGVLDSASMGEELAWLDDRLREIIDVTTGQPAVADVVRSADLYDHDPVHHQLADLLVEWRKDGPQERLWSPTIGHLHAPARTARSGDHDPEGVMYVASPNAAPVEAVIGAADVAAVIAGSVGLTLTLGAASERSSRS